jgi:hypothetical protein
MAQVRLGRYEAEEGELPPFCLRCGAPATRYKARQLSWQPVWTYFVLGLTFWPLLYAVLLFRKRLRVLAPFCDRHRNYWTRRGALAKCVLGGLLVVLMLGNLLFLYAEAVGVHIVHPLIPFWLSGAAMLMVIGLLRIKSICPTEITDDSISLKGVAEAFVAQLRAERNGNPFRPGVVVSAAPAPRAPLVPGPRQ